MGEEEKKPVEEKKVEEKKPENVEENKKKEEEREPEKPPGNLETQPEKDSKESKESKEEEKKPQDIVLRVYMHCEGCARKVRRCLKGFEGVEDVMTDCKSGKVVVKGEKADPLKVLERVQRKSHRQVELLSPLPEPKSAEEPEKKAEEEKPKGEEKKEEPQIVTVVLRVHMHCEACAMEIQKRIQRMKGVESAEPNLKASEVTVKGEFEPSKLVEYVYKRTGKHAAIAKQDPPSKTEKKEKEETTEEKGKEKKNPEEEGKGKIKGEEAKENNDGGGEAKPAGDGGGAKADEASATAEETKVLELTRNDYYYYQPRYPMEMYAYPPQIFSDENPNACTVM